MWKLATESARMVVSVPPPIMLMASLRKRMADSSSGGRLDLKSVLSSVSCFSSKKASLLSRTDFTWLSTSCQQSARDGRDMALVRTLS